MKNNTKKYKIEDYLLGLNVKEYRKALKKLPQLLGISVNTFHNYRRIQSDDVQDIPYGKVVMMEKIFDLRPGTLMNYDPEVKRLKDIL
ncbi:hypothetical protein HDE68_002940 [Pedobacter cryoconitis]|uniref:HTH cro/C1-type domain-containing protein n=1 Tax=Pedobacter cryoconitis TaxID=188932 RepID=A0A7W9DZ84_9SPHI|nr:hypothetical protein [Pedobacter cryoconitis]MBB5637027.1 hypothetical protein [Pedobacter cryoconitis]